MCSLLLFCFPSRFRRSGCWTGLISCLASQPLTIPSFSPSSFPFSASSLISFGSLCVSVGVKGVARWGQASDLHSSPTELQAVYIIAGSEPCSLRLCSGFIEPSSGSSAQHRRRRIRDFCLMSSIQHPPHSAVLLTGITITFCALRAAQMGWGVPETTGFGGYKGTDIILHLLTLPAESIHHACLWGWSLSLSFIFFPPAGFFTADKGKRLMKEVTFHSPYLLIASLCCWAAPDRNTMQATSHFKDTRQSPRLWSKDHSLLCIDNVWWLSVCKKAWEWRFKNVSKRKFK